MRVSQNPTHDEEHYPGCNCHQESYPSTAWSYDERCLWYPDRELTTDERRLFVLEKRVENYTHIILALIYLGFALSSSRSEHRTLWFIGVVALLVLLNALSEKSIEKKSIQAKVESSSAMSYSSKKTMKGR
jgi:hypothetical protein